MKTLLLVLLASLFMLAIPALRAADADTATPNKSKLTLPPVLSGTDEMALMRLLRRIDHDQVLMDQAKDAEQDQGKARQELSALVTKVSPAGYHIEEPHTGELRFVKNPPETAKK